MKLLKSLLILVPALVLTACTATPEECDPTRDPGFFNKIGCVFSGSYSQRVEQKKVEIEQLRQEQKDVLEAYQALEANRSKMIADRAERYRQLDKLDNDIAKVRASLAKKNALTKEYQQKLDKLQKASNEARNLDDAGSLEKSQKLQEVQDSTNELLEAFAQ